MTTQLIQTGRYAEAYQLLIKDKTLSVETLFNLSLCYLSANLYSQALQALQKADTALRLGLTSISLGRDTEMKEIETKQNRGEAYRQPITKEYVQLFPEIAKMNIKRLQIDCYLALEDWQSVIRYTANLTNKGYLNIENAIKIAQKK